MGEDKSAHRSWLVSERPVLIAGPCSAESEAQLMQVAKDILPMNPAYIRAGIWKPRTRPGAFEGIGEIGLQWLKKVKELYGVPTIVEVASAHHLQLALEYGIDAVWIGARSTVNPFTVQEIADALRGVDIPVFVKNPVNPDLFLWVGAIERVAASGVKRIAAIHRGFSTYDRHIYRNEPMWEIPLDLRRILPDIPVLCDPSHITGKDHLVAEIAQRAMDLHFEGLMFEVHPDPVKAWSDAAQQLTPAVFIKIVKGLIIRTPQTDDILFNNKLEELRAGIDRLDEEIVKALAERMDIAQEIGVYKKDNNITIYQAERWKEVMDTRSGWAGMLGLSPEFIQHVFRHIQQESIRRQTKVMNEDSAPIT